MGALAITILDPTRSAAVFAVSHLTEARGWPFILLISLVNAGGSLRVRRVGAVDQLLERLLGDGEGNVGDVARGAGLQGVEQRGYLPGGVVVLPVQLDQSSEELHNVHQGLRVFFGSRDGFGRNSDGVAKTNATAHLVDGRQQITLHRTARIGYVG